MTDTIFVLREFNPEYHAIYIEKNKSSPLYDLLTKFKLEDEEKTFITEAYKSFIQSRPKAKSIEPGLKSLWLPLFPYKGKLYLYAPSDWGNTGRRVITDSIIYLQYLDGPYPYFIESFEKLAAREYRFRIFDSFKNDDVFRKPEELIISFNKDSSLALWKYKTRDSVSAYRSLIMVPAKFAKNYEIIVNHSEFGKQVEFEFSETEMDKFIKDYFTP